MSERQRPTLESVRRRLFFDEDTNPEDLASPLIGVEMAEAQNIANATLEQQEQAEYQRARERWNFDFENEIPLEGNWVWEKVDTQPQRYQQVVEKQQDQNEDLDEENELGKVQSDNGGNHSL